MTIPNWFTKCYVKDIEQVNIIGSPDNIAYLLYNVLNEKQCDWLNNLLNTHSNTKHVSEDGYHRNYRDCERLQEWMPDLGEYILKRISNYTSVVMHIDNTDNKLLERGIAHNRMSYGRWKLYGLNPRFRLCKYIEGGHFAPHFDGDYERDPNCKSFKTFMVYTNTVNDGGTTDFIDYKTKEVYYEVKPVMGMAIIFNHHLYHQGSPLKSGVKYIVRSDIMYTRIKDEDWSEGMKLLTEAKDAENNKDYDTAVTKYKQAFTVCPVMESEYFNME